MKMLVGFLVVALVCCAQFGGSFAAEPATKRPQTAGSRTKCDNPKELNDAEVKCEPEVMAGGKSQVFQRMRTCVLTEIGLMRDEAIVESAAKDFVTKFTGDAGVTLNLLTNYIRLVEIKNSINNCFNQKAPEKLLNCVNENIRRSCVRDRSLLATDKPTTRK